MAERTFCTGTIIDNHKVQYVTVTVALLGKAGNKLAMCLGGSPTFDSFSHVLRRNKRSFSMRRWPVRITTQSCAPSFLERGNEITVHECVGVVGGNTAFSILTPRKHAISSAVYNVQKFMYLRQINTGIPML